MKPHGAYKSNTIIYLGVEKAIGNKYVLCQTETTFIAELKIPIVILLKETCHTQTHTHKHTHNFQIVKCKVTDIKRINVHLSNML